LPLTSFVVLGASPPDRLSRFDNGALGFYGTGLTHFFFVLFYRRAFVCVTNRIFACLLLRMIILRFASFLFFFFLKGTSSFWFQKLSPHASLGSCLWGVTDDEDIPCDETTVPDESSVAVGLISVIVVSDFTPFLFFPLPFLFL
jgi:hypothetical protein